MLGALAGLRGPWLGWGSLNSDAPPAAESCMPVSGVPGGELRCHGAGGHLANACLNPTTSLYSILYNLTIPLLNLTFSLEYVSLSPTYDLAQVQKARILEVRSTKTAQHTKIRIQKNTM